MITKTLPALAIAVLCALAAGGASADDCVGVRPRCARVPEGADTPQQLAFTFTLASPDNQPRIFVYALSGDQDKLFVKIEVVQGSPAPAVIRTHTIFASTATSRLRPSAWCRSFLPANAASGLKDAVQAAKKLKPLEREFGRHRENRSQVTGKENDLLSAIADDDQVAIASLRGDLQSLEQVDAGILMNIDGLDDQITANFGGSLGADGAIVEIDLHAFRVKDDDPSKYVIVPEADASTPAGGAAPPMAIWLNDDDDDFNAAMDRTATGTVMNEDDLAQLWWFFARPLRAPAGIGEWDLTVQTPSATLTKISFWSLRTKGTSKALPSHSADPAARDGVYLEGLQVSDGLIGEQFTADIGTPEGCHDDVRVVVLGVDAVVFEAGVAGATNFETATGPSFGIPGQAAFIPGGEYRLFPCKNDPSDARHDEVDVKVTLKPPRPLQRVWLAPLDVDDPSSSTPPLDNDAAGSDVEDNRLTVASGMKNGRLVRTNGTGTGDELGRIDDVTDGSGQLVVRFRVGECMQPGNNFRALAAFSKPALGGLPLVAGRPDPKAKVYELTSGGLGRTVPENVDDAGAPVDPSQRKQSPLLTIWRKLHIEGDSMASPAGNQNKILGEIKSFTVIPPTSLNQYLVEIDASVNDKDRFITEGNGPSGDKAARLVAAPGGDYKILGNTQGSPTFVTIELTAGQPTPTLNQIAALVDDDRVDPPSGAPTTPAILPMLPNINVMVDKYAKAYVLPIDDGGGMGPGAVQVNLPFVENVANTTEAGEAVINSGFNSEPNRSLDFWIAYVASAFQKNIEKDADPNSSGAATPLGTSFGGGFSASGLLFNRGSLIWVESSRDVCFNQHTAPESQLVVGLARVATHEVGHQFGLIDGTGGMMDPLDFNDPPPDFTPGQLSLIRQKVESPGKLDPP